MMAPNVVDRYGTAAAAHSHSRPSNNKSKVKIVYLGILYKIIKGKVLSGLHRNLCCNSSLTTKKPKMG